MRWFALVPLCLALSGCGWLGNLFPGVSGADSYLEYRASARAGEDDRRQAIVRVVVPAEVSLDGFRESARLAVTRYCIDTVGISDADWDIDAATGDWAVARTEREAVLTARCVGR